MKGNTPKTLENFLKLDSRYTQNDYELYVESFKREVAQRAKTAEHNCVAAIAHKDERDYITPEDVGEALKTNETTKVRLDVLECLGNITQFGVEDRGLTAFVAFEGKK